MKIYNNNKKNASNNPKSQVIEEANGNAARGTDFNINVYAYTLTTRTIP